MNPAGVIVPFDGSTLPIDAALFLDSEISVALTPDGSVAGILRQAQNGFVAFGAQRALGPGGVILDVATGAAVATSVRVVQEGMAVLGADSEVVGFVKKDGTVGDCSGMHLSCCVYALGRKERCAT